MTAKQLKDRYKIDVEHALYRKNGTWYHHLNKFPGALLDENGYVVFDTETEYLNNPSLRHKSTLHVRGGISLINGYRFFNGEKNAIDSSVRNNLSEETIRKIREVNLIVRDSKLVEEIKNIYKSTCQICDLQLQIKSNQFYSEVHHIKPLGSKHNGPDILENMICVCPNHHALLDLGGIKLDVDKLCLKHELRKEFVEYHNKKIFQKFS